MHWKKGIYVWTEGKVAYVSCLMSPESSKLVIESTRTGTELDSKVLWKEKPSFPPSLLRGWTRCDLYFEWLLALHDLVHWPLTSTRRSPAHCRRSLNPSFFFFFINTRNSCVGSTFQSISSLGSVQIRPPGTNRHVHSNHRHFHPISSPFWRCSPLHQRWEATQQRASLYDERLVQSAHYAAAHTAGPLQSAQCTECVCWYSAWRKVLRLIYSLPPPPSAVSRHH